MSNPRRWVRWPLLALLTLLMIGSCGILAFTACHPSNEVQVVLKNVPSDTVRVSMAAQIADGHVEMEWRPPKSFDVRDHHMPHYQMERVVTESAGKGFRFTVYWWRADRYGVVLKNLKDEWRVAWFHAADVPVQGRNWFGGAGWVEFDLNKAEIVPLDKAVVEELELEVVDRPRRQWGSATSQSKVNGNLATLTLPVPVPPSAIAAGRAAPARA